MTMSDVKQQQINRFWDQLPTRLRQDLTLQRGEIQIQHAQDVKAGDGIVDVPDALARKDSNAPKALGWH